MIPVADPDAVVQLEEILRLNLADDSYSWSLDPDGKWRRIPTLVGTSAQDTLQAAALERSLQFDDPLRPPPPSGSDNRPLARRETRAERT